jgi:hypothetical protein
LARAILLEDELAAVKAVAPHVYRDTTLTTEFKRFKPTTLLFMLSFDPTCRFSFDRNTEDSLSLLVSKRSLTITKASLFHSALCSDKEFLMHCSIHVYERPSRCLSERSDNRHNRLYTVSRDRSRKLANEKTTGTLLVTHIKNHVLGY